ncbi:MAG: glycosyltransferase family 4 protein [Bacteroidia bacterium]
MHILCLPSWYPNKYDENSGIFIKKHIDLIAENHLVSVIYIHADTDKRDNRIESEVQFSGNLIEYRYYYRKSNIFFDTFYHLSCLVKGYREIIKKSGKPDICHLFVAYPAGLGALYLKFVHRLNFILTEHWTGFTKYDPRYNEYRSPVKKLIKKVFKNSLAVSAISKYLINELQENNFTEEKAILISNKLDLEQAEIINKNFNSELPVAITVSNLDDFHKNVKGLIDAMKIVTETYPKFILYIVGDGPDMKMLTEHAKLNKMLDINVMFTGAVPNKEVPDYYSMADFFILNSNFETFSIATAEAIAHGLPVIVTKSGGPEEFVDDTNGILVERDNPESLAGAIIKMIQNYTYYEREVISAAIKKRYHNDTIREQLNNFYKIASSNHQP